MSSFIIQDHTYSDNGFCTICDQYQPVALNSSGVYEIGNAGQLLWFASLVNGDNTHADFDKQDAGANAVLVKDIDLESREWSPIRGITQVSLTDKTTQFQTLKLQKLLTIQVCSEAFTAQLKTLPLRAR